MKKKRVLVILPIFLISTTAIVFRGTSTLLGASWATIIGHTFYQIIWCISIPILLIGKNNFIALFKESKSNRLFQKKNTLYMVLLSLTIIGAVPLFISNLSSFSIVIFLLGIPLTTINSSCEETLWRGTYIHLFNKNRIMAIVFPTIFFALWHISPELVNESINIETIFFLPLMALPLGFIYSIVAYRTNSIKWVAISHSLSGILAFGLPLSTSIADILGVM